MVSGDQFDYVSSRIVRLERQGDDFSSRRFDFLAAGHEMGPVGALDQNVGEKGGDECAGRLLVEKSHGIDGFESQRQLGAFLLGNDGAVRPLHAARAGVGVESQNEHVAKRACRFQGADVPGMEQIKAPVGENDSLTLPPPALALLDKLGVIVEPAQGLKNSVTSGPAELEWCVEMGWGRSLTCRF